MPTAKIAITLDRYLLAEVDRLVTEKAFANRSQAIQEALREKLLRRRRQRLASESAKLDIAEERLLAEEGLLGEQDTWPEY